MTHAPVPLSLDVVFDVVCPWCFVGFRRLGRALDNLDVERPSVRWRPFQLDPTIPRDGMERESYMLAKFGSRERIESAHERLREIGAKESIAFRFDRIARSPNTLDAHRLIRWAGGIGAASQGDLVGELFSRYFEQGEDLGDPDVLASAAEAIGLPGDEWRKRLTSDEDRDAVRDEAENYSRMGVSGVPCFILANRYAISGAQEADVLTQAIEDVAREIVEAGGSA